MPLSQICYRRRNLAAWLGILSILMLFIAPVISQSLEQLSGHNLPTHCGNATSHHHDITEKHISNADWNNQSHSESISRAEHAACSYCLLLNHLPLLNGIDNIVVGLIPFIIRSTSHFFIFLFIFKDTYPDLQPRAPPTLLF